jgi:hypothetical protein
MQLLLATLAVCLAALPLNASFLFSDLASTTPLYNAGSGTGVEGSAIFGGAEEAMEFAVSGTGSESVGQIDLALSLGNNPDRVNVAIFTVGTGRPGVEVTNASWTGVTVTAASGTCCILTTISGITNVTLTGGTSYYMVLSPNTTTTNLTWDDENLGISNDRQLSTNGGTTWTDLHQDTLLGAFDVVSALSTPAPAGMLLMASGLALLATFQKLRS